MSPPPRVLVIRGGAVGDFILTLPAIRLLRENLPGCHLEVLGYPGIVDLAVKAGMADSVRSLEHRSMALLFARGAVIEPALVEYLCGFNLVVSYLFDPDGILRGNLERIGVKALIECPHRVVPGQGHAAEQLAKPLQRLAMFLEEPAWRRPFFGPPAPEAGRLAVHLGSGSEKKNWPVENWQRLLAEIQEARPDLKLAVITGEAEAARGVGSGPMAVEHWHGLSLPALTDRLLTCELFLGHDSGISHLAAACGVPAMLLFGPTDPDVWAPVQRMKEGATNPVAVIRSETGVIAELPLDFVHETVMPRVRELPGK